MYNRPMRTSRNHRNNKNNLSLWVAIFLDVAILAVNYTNLQYNRMQAYQSARVADQLSRLNQSNLMIDINNQLQKENCKKEE